MTTLADYGVGQPPVPGSLRAAVETEGPRTIVFRVSGTIARPPESERVRAQAKRPPLRRGKAGVPAATSWGLVHRALSSQAAHPLGNGRRSASGRAFLWGGEAVVAQRAENEASVVAASSARDQATPRPLCRNETLSALCSNIRNVLMTSHEQERSCSAVSDAKRRAIQSHRRLTFRGRSKPGQLLSAVFPRSTSTVSDRCRQSGHDKAIGLPDSERIRPDG